MTGVVDQFQALSTPAKVVIGIGVVVLLLVAVAVFVIFLAVVGAFVLDLGEPAVVTGVAAVAGGNSTE